VEREKRKEKRRNGPAAAAVPAALYFLLKGIYKNGCSNFTAVPMTDPTAAPTRCSCRPSYVMPLVLLLASLSAVVCQSGEYGEVIHRSRTIDSYTLDDPGADHQARAIEMDEKGDLQAAVASFRSAVKFTPDDSSFWNNLGVAILEAEKSEDGTGNGTKEGNKKEAMASFKKAVEIDPTNSEAQHGFIGLLLTTGKNMTEKLLEQLAAAKEEGGANEGAGSAAPALPFLPPRDEL
jgi:tetratricopeptide (TPR) repeat protein